MTYSLSCSTHGCTRAHASCRLGANTRAIRSMAPRSAVRVRIIAKHDSDASSGASKHEPRLRLLSSISRLCEVKGMTSVYETVAGRSAMLGVATALAFETLSEGEALLSQLTCTNWVIALAAFGASTLAAVLLGVRSLEGQEAVLLEPVITSLTAAQRSASSVTLNVHSNIDRVVDEVVTTTFTTERLRELTDFDSDL